MRSRREIRIFHPGTFYDTITGMWFWYALSVMVMWGLGDVIAKKGLSKISPVWNNILAVAFALVGWVPFALWHGATLTFGPTDLVLAATISLLYLTYYYAIERGKIILTAALLSTYQATSYVLSVLLLHEQNTLFQNLAVVIIIIGTFLISGEEMKKLLDNHVREAIHRSWIFWGLLGGFANGVGDFLSKVGVVRVGPYNFLLLLALGYVLTIGVNILFDRRGLARSPLQHPALFFFTFLGTALVELGIIPLSLAFETGPASLITPIASASLGVTIVLAWIFLRERVTWIQMLGVITTIGGLFLMRR